eukprot:10534284-Ditylum_brightwellii.AAC.1
MVWECEGGHQHICEAVTRESDPMKGRDGKMYRKEKLSLHENNVKVVLAALTRGVGAEEIKNLLIMFDLPYGKDLKGQFYCVERDDGRVLMNSTRRSMEEALREEIKATLIFNHD